MLKMYGQILLFTVTVIQCCTVVIASDNKVEVSKIVTIIPKLNLLDLRPSIHYSHAMYDVNRKESPEEAERFRLLMGSLLLRDRRDDRLIQNKNSLSIMIPSESFARVEELDSQDSFESVCQNIDTTVPFSQFEHVDTLRRDQSFCPGVRPKVTRNRFFSEVIDEKNLAAGYESDRDDSQRHHIKRCCNTATEEQLLSSSIFLEPLEGENFSDSNLSVFTGLLSDDDQSNDQLSISIFNTSPASTIINEDIEHQDEL